MITKEKGLGVLCTSRPGRVQQNALLLDVQVKPASDEVRLPPGYRKVSVKRCKVTESICIDVSISGV